MDEISNVLKTEEIIHFCPEKPSDYVIKFNLHSGKDSTQTGIMSKLSYKIKGNLDSLDLGLVLLAIVALFFIKTKFKK